MSVFFTAGIREYQQRLVWEDKQLEDDRAIGDYAAASKIPLEGWAPTFYLGPHLRAGMFHATSGRQDNDALMEDGVHFTKVCCCGKLLGKGWGLVQVVGSVMQKGQSWFDVFSCPQLLGCKTEGNEGEGN
jgi:hypothetical protein